MIAYGSHYGGDVLRTHVHPIQEPESHDGSALGMVYPVHYISYVVKITGDLGKFHLMIIISQQLKYASCQFGNLVDVGEAVLCVSQRQKRLIGLGNIGFYISVIFYIFKSYIHTYHHLLKTFSAKPRKSRTRMTVPSSRTALPLYLPNT